MFYISYRWRNVSNADSTMSADFWLVDGQIWESYYCFIEPHWVIIIKIIIRIIITVVGTQLLCATHLWRVSDTLLIVLAELWVHTLRGCLIFIDYLSINFCLLFCSICLETPSRWQCYIRSNKVVADGRGCQCLRDCAHTWNNGGNWQGPWKVSQSMPLSFFMPL